MTETAKEYGLALFELAKEQANEREFFNALNEISEVFAQNREYYELLYSYNVPCQERVKLIDTALCEKYPEYIVSFIKLLCEKGRITLFDECIKEYGEFLKQSEKVSDAGIISVVELSDGEKEKIVKKLEKISGNTVVPHYELNPEILGGVLIYMDDTVIDGTLRNKLKDVKEVLGR